MSEKLLSLREAAKLSGVHQDYLRVLINRKSIAGVMQGRDWFVAESEIQQYLARPKKRGKKLSHTYREAPPKFTSLRPRASQFETALASTEKLNLASLLNSHSHPSFNLEGEKSIFWNKVFKHSPAVAAVSALLIFSLFQFASTKFGNEQLAGLFENFRPFFSDLFSSKSGNLEVGEPIEFSNNEPEDAVAKEVATTTPEATPTIIREVVKQVTEVVERKEVFVPADVSRLEGNVANSIDGKIAPLRAELASLSSEFFSIRGNLDTTSRVAGSSITMVTQSQRIDELDSIDIDNGATIRSGNLSINAGGITASGSLTLGENLTVSGSATFSTLSVGVSTAGYFTATSTTATSTFAGGLTIEGTGFVYDFTTNRVGIGTSSPSALFAVAGDVLISGNITSASSITSTSTVQADKFIATGASATSTFAGGLTIEDSGLVYDFTTNRVGIGTSTPVERLHVSAGGSYASVRVGQAYLMGRETNNDIYLLSNAKDSTTNYITSQAAAMHYIDDGFFSWQSAPTGTAGGTISWNERMRLTIDGNLGIGINAPSAMLHVSTTTPGGNVDIFRLTVGSDAFILNSGGRIGFGTSTPGAYLSLSAATTVPAFLLNQTSTGDLLTLQDSGTTAFVVRDGGNVGVSSSTPWGKLSVEMDTTNPSLVISNNGSTTPAFYIGGVNQDGNIGIGTAAPTSKLNIVNTNASNSITRDLTIHHYGQGGTAGDGTGILFQINPTAANIAAMDVVHNPSNSGEFRFITLNPNSGSLAERARVGAGFMVTGSNETISGPTSATTAGSNIGMVQTVYDTTNNKGVIRSVLWGTSFQPLYFQGNEFRWSTGTSVVTEKMVLDVNGNVGIGTSTPGGLLSVSGGTTYPAFLLNQTSTGDLLTLQDSGTTAFIVKDGGNIGIGTSSPSAKFSLTAGGTGTGRVFAIANSSNAEKVTILDNGNVGIGSTSPATYPLEVFSSAGNYVASFVNNTNGGAHGRGVYIKVEGNGSGDNTALKIEKGFSTVTTLFDVNGSTGNAYMSGTVGIGTTTPVMGKLSVNAGDTSASVYAGAFVSETGVHDQGVYIQVAGNGAGDTTAFRINKSNGGMKTIFNVDGTTELTYLTGQLGVGTTTPGGFLSVSGGTAYPAFLLNQTSTGDLLTLQDSGSTAFIVKDGGNVGVGTTNSTQLGQHRLTVAQDVVMSISDLTAAQIIAAGATNPAKKLMVGFDTTNNFGFIAAGEQAVAWRNLALQPFGGSVGIGTTTPQARINSGATPMLNIAGVSTPSLVLHDTSTAQESSIATDGAGLYFDVAGHATASNNDFIFRVGQSDASYTMSEAFRINNDKRVGVGTSSPGALFSVGGDVYAGKFGALVAAPSALFDGRNDANGETNGLLIENANSGTAAFASAVIRNSNSAGNGLRLGALGTGYTTGGVYVQDGAWIESEAGLSGGLSIGTLASAPIRFYTSGFTNERLRITESGLVGIGTSSPASLLNIGNTGAAQFTITDTDASTNQKHWYLQSNAGSFAIGTSSDAYTAQTARLTINTSGQLLTEDGSVSAPAYSFANDGDVGIIRTTTNTMGFVTGGVQHVTIGPPTGGFQTPRVGIGTTTPFALLQSAVNTNLNDLQLVITDTIADTNKKHWYLRTTGGSFLVGTTSDAYSISAAQLSIDTSGVLQTNRINSTYYHLNGVASGEYLTALNANTIGFAVDNVTHMVLTVGGAFQDARLGVGTSTPFGMVQIALNQNIEHPHLVLTNTIGATDQKHWYIQTIGGALQFGTTTDAYAMATARFSINANGTLTQNGSIALTNGDLTLSDDRFIGLGSSAGRIVFDDQTTDEIEILSANVGIGTSTPGGLLSVSGGTTYPALLLNQTSTGDLLTLQDSGTTVFTVRDGGNIGIGTTTPQDILHIESSQNGQTTFQIGNPNTGAAATAAIRLSNVFNSADQDNLSIQVMGTSFTTAGGFTQDGGVITAEENLSGGLNLITRNSSAPIRFYTAGHTNERMRITEAGLVGIGTTTPSAALAISGAESILSVSGGSGNNGPYMSFENISTGGKWRFLIGGPNNGVANGTLIVRNQDLSADMMYFHPSTRTGFGTTSPGAILSVSAATTSPAFMVAQTSTGDIMRLLDGGTTAFIVKDGADTGIATSSPYARLSVTGGDHVLALAGGLGNTGMYFTLNNTSTGGSWRFMIGGPNDGLGDGGLTIRNNDYATNVMHFSPSGRTGFGTTTAGGLLSISAATTVPAFLINQTSTGDLLTLQDSGATAFRVTDGAITSVLNSTGLGIGTSSPTGRLGQSLNVVTTASYGGAAFTTWSGAASDHSAVLDFNRSRSSTAGTHTVVQSGDILGHVMFRGSDGTQFVDAAYIVGHVDGTPGTNDMPGRLLFYTTPDGSNAAVERMRITNAGNVGVGTTTPWRLLSVAGSVGFGGLTTAAGTPSAICLSADKEVVVNTGTATCTVSSERFKENIEYNDTGGLVTVRALKPASFTYKEGDGEERIGFVAEDVVEIDPRLVFTENDGTTVRGVRYEDLTAVLAQAIYELDEKLNLLASSTLVASGQSLATNAWSVDQSTGKVNVNFYGDVDLHGNNLLGVNQIVSQNGLWSINDQGRMVMKAIEVGELTVGTTEKPAGVTLFDQTTKAPYCVVVDQGAVRTLAGSCGAQGQGTADSGQGIGSAAETESTNESAGTATTTPITTEPASGTTEITPTSDTSTTESTDSSTTTPAEV